MTSRTRRQNTSTDAYTAFSLQERFTLAIKAQLREDLAEYNRLIETCPRCTYSQTDRRLVDMLCRAKEAAWHFFSEWSGALRAREHGVNEVLDAAARVFDSLQLERLRRALYYGRKNVRRYPEFVAEMALQDHMTRWLEREQAEEDAPDRIGVFIPQAWLFATGPDARPSGYAQFVQYLCSLAEGFRRYAICAELSVEEALAPLPELIREKLIQQIAALPEIPWDEDTAEAYGRYLAADVFVQEMSRNEREDLPEDYEQAARDVALSMRDADDSDLTLFDSRIAWHHDNLDRIVHVDERVKSDM